MIEVSSIPTRRTIAVDGFTKWCVESIHIPRTISTQRIQYLYYAVNSQKSEERRGKRPLDSTAIAETRRRRAALRELLPYSTPGEFEELMREAGIEPRSED